MSQGPFESLNYYLSPHYALRNFVSMNTLEDWPVLDSEDCYSNGWWSCMMDGWNLFSSFFPVIPYWDAAYVLLVYWIKSRFLRVL